MNKKQYRQPALTLCEVDAAQPHIMTGTGNPDNVQVLGGKEADQSQGAMTNERRGTWGDMWE